MKVAIYEVVNDKRGPLVAHVTERGKVVPDGEATGLTEGIVQHVDQLRAQEKLRGQEFLQRVQRSYTNGYMTARIVR